MMTRLRKWLKLRNDRRKLHTFIVAHRNERITATCSCGNFHADGMCDTVVIATFQHYRDKPHDDDESTRMYKYREVSDV